MTGHAVFRFAGAFSVDPIKALLAAHEDLAVSRQVSHREAELFLGSTLRHREGRTYRLGASGVYVCVENRVLTYIDRERPQEFKIVKGYRARNRGGAWVGACRRAGRSWRRR